jgi:ABC-type phosphate/phosphonate transport system substrate-binding protein
MGVRPGFFGRVVEAGFHQRAIRLVHAGVMDATAIESQVLAVELRDHPDLTGLRVIGSFGPSTIQPVVAASCLPSRLKEQAYFVEQKADEDVAGRLDQIMERLDRIETRLPNEDEQHRERSRR